MKHVIGFLALALLSATAYSVDERVHDVLRAQHELLRAQSDKQVSLDYFIRQTMGNKSRVIASVKSPDDFVWLIYKGTIDPGLTWAKEYKEATTRLIMENLPVFLSLSPTIQQVLDLQDAILENQTGTTPFEIEQTVRYILELKQKYLPRIKTVQELNHLSYSGFGNVWSNTIISSQFKEALNRFLFVALTSLPLKGSIQDYLRLENYVLTLQTDVATTVAMIREIKRLALKIAKNSLEKDYALQICAGNPHALYIEMVRELRREFL